MFSSGIAFEILKTAYFLFTFFLSKWNKAWWIPLFKEYQARLHWSTSLPALLSKRISKIIGKVKSMFFCPKKLEQHMETSNLTNTAATNFSKYSCMNHIPRMSHILISQPLVGLGGGGYAKRCAENWGNVGQGRGSILVLYTIDLDDFDRVAQSLVLEKWFRGQWGSGNVINVTVNQTKPLSRLQPPADGRPFYLVKNSLSSLIKEVEGSRTVLKVISF